MEKKVAWHSLSNYDALIESALKTGFISENDLLNLKKWREAPEQWGALYA